MLSFSTEVLITWSNDGRITLRETREPERSMVRLTVFERPNGSSSQSPPGITSNTTNVGSGGEETGASLRLCQSRDTRMLVSGGSDGTLRFHEWKYTLPGKKAAAQSSKAAEAVLENQAQIIVESTRRIQDAPAVPDFPDTTEEIAISDDAQLQRQNAAHDASEQQTIERKASEKTSTKPIEAKIQQIREKLNKIIQKNESLPELEKINRDDFIIDFEERARLLAASDDSVAAVRKEIGYENLKKQVITSKIKKECWDSMEVTGQSVKSFHVDPLTSRVTEVSNYPLRRRSDEELGKIERVKLLRVVQLMSEEATKDQAHVATPMFYPSEDDGQIDEHGQGGANSSSKATEASKPTNIKVTPSPSMATQDMLYGPFELNTSERRRTQIVLLGEVVHQVKRDFNKRVKENVHYKRDEIAKIEDKNDRIKEIMEELQISEALFHPELDDSETPERIIEVRDDEVKCERFISPEEQKRIDDRRRQEEERLRASQEDDSRDRALQAMMGGKLEDRSTSEEKEELIRPVWMNKPKSDLTEDERKLVKEFEKKLATQKEEQEKYRKALETELRKSQGAILELCAAFDEKLRDFFRAKLLTDQIIDQHELKIIKLCQATYYSEEDEVKETQLLTKLDDLKAEKTACMVEIPEIKKDLERYREELDMATKRDKELDRLFKKEFVTYDFYYEALSKLFRRREIVSSENEKKQSSTDSSLNPFAGDQQDRSQISDFAAREISELNLDTDLPEGLPSDLWTKLIDLRHRKIAAESEVHLASVRFSEMQALVASVMEGSERIRGETERVASEYVDFMERKFHNTYNIESLFALKQGQVEVPQAPVVTDYSNAVLVHRGVVEKLNEAIETLGKAKVDALKEMKEYRKGIHALEWENKMLDFQAEDLIIRTRDIQLLRVTKQMQEYIRGGDEQKHSAEIATLERRAEHGIKAHSHKIDEKRRAIHKLKRKIREKNEENEELDARLTELQVSVGEREKIHSIQGSNPDTRLKAIADRSKLVDLAKSQQQDLNVLREEVERLRMRTFPAFTSDAYH